MSLYQEVFADMQTSITAGIAGGVAGILSTKLSSLIEEEAKIGGSDLGDLTLRFVIDALGSSIVYMAVARLAPETSANTYFSYIYFLADSGLTTTTLELANKIVGILPL